MSRRVVPERCGGGLGYVIAAPSQLLAATRRNAPRAPPDWGVDSAANPRYSVEHL